jgi:RNase P/RNase MRP subunit p30
MKLFRPTSEKALRHALEKSSERYIVGVETLHPKDHTHYPRSGLDQVLCKIAASKKKVICFSVEDILSARDRGTLLRRMMFNIKLCKKYGVEMLFKDFSGKRSGKDVHALFRLLGG